MAIEKALGKMTRMLYGDETCLYKLIEIMSGKKDSAEMRNEFFQDLADFYKKHREVYEKYIEADPECIVSAGDGIDWSFPYSDVMEVFKMGGIKPEDTMVREVQKQWIWESIHYTDDPEYADRLDKLKESVNEEGLKVTIVDVENIYSQLLDGFLTDNKKIKESISSVQNVTGVTFEKDIIIPLAYSKAFSTPYIIRAEEIFKKTGMKFVPENEKDVELIKQAYEKISKWDNLALPEWIQFIRKISGVDPTPETLYRVGREKAEKVREGKLYPGYLKEFVEATGLKDMIKGL